MLQLFFIVTSSHKNISLFFSGNDTFFTGGFFNFYHVIRHNGKEIKNINSQTGILFSEAMHFALEKINNDSKFLHGFKIAPEFVDVTYTDNLIHHHIIPGYFGLMPYAIGPMLSRDAYEMATVGNAIYYPLVSYYASFDRALISKYSYFYRSVPTDAFRILAMLDVVKALKWNYLAIIASYELNGDTMARAFMAELPNIPVSVSDYREMRLIPTENHYDVAVRYISNNKRVKALVLFTTNEDSAGILRALGRANLTSKFQILAANGFTNYVEVTSGNEKIAEGAISVEYKTKEIPEFRDYFLKLNPKTRTSTEFQKFWEFTFQCTLTPHPNQSIPNCTTNEKLQPGKGYYANTPVHLVIDAVYSMAYAYRHTIEILCPPKKGSYCPIDQTAAEHRTPLKIKEYLRSKAYPDLTVDIKSPLFSTSKHLVEYDILNYVKDGNSHKNFKVGHWSMKRDNLSGTYYLNRKVNSNFQMDVTRLRFKGNTGKIMSVCSLPCQSGEYQMPNKNFRQLTCWDCQKCPENHIVVNNTCEKCSDDYKPDKNFLICTKIPVRYLNIKNNIVLPILLALSIVGIVLTIITTMVFLKNNNNRIVRAAGRDLCYFMLVGISLVFITPVFFIRKPTSILCALRTIFPGLAFVMVYAPLFLKTNRIYRIFRNAKISVTRPPLVSPQSQVLILTGIIGMQLLLGIVWAASKQLKVHKYVSVSREFVVHHCGNDPLPLMMNLIISVVFMVVCTWYAFKTRNFPKNYNEAKYIGFTMYTTCIFWAVFLPTYFMTKEDLSDNRELIMVAIFILMGYITLIGLFGRKVSMLLFPETVNLKASNAPSSTTTDSLRQTPLALNETIDLDDPTKKLSNKSTFCQLEHLKTELSDSASVCSETKIDAYPPLAEPSPIPTEACM